jgi:ABC-type uncharacterized transport system ATPase subunit
MTTPLVMQGISRVVRRRGGAQRSRLRAAPGGEIHGWSARKTVPAKSTLMKKIAGVHGVSGPHDDRWARGAFRSARDAPWPPASAVVHRVSVVPDLTVAENVILANSRPAPALSTGTQFSGAREHRQSGIDVDPRPHGIAGDQCSN